MGRESRARIAAKFDPSPRPPASTVVRCLECATRTTDAAADLRAEHPGRCHCGGQLLPDTAKTSALIVRRAEFKKLARQIRDRDHLPAIIATVHPRMRTAVERELLKHVTFLV